MQHRRPAPVKKSPPRPRPAAAPAPASALAPVEPSAGYRAITPELDFDGPIGTEIFNTLERVRAHQAAVQHNALVGRGLVELRGYQRSELFALAEIGYHYLLSGGVRIAQAIFEGLCAIDPTEPYFALALGLAYDHLERLDDAAGCYRRAAELDPSDGRAEINLAELELVRGNRQGARSHLMRARVKCSAKGAEALLHKAEAMLHHLSDPRRRS
jgi:tetratricopeptide (TPR) repeat protein